MRNGQNGKSSVENGKQKRNECVCVCVCSYRIMAANSQFGLPGSIFISAFFCSFISACWARRFSRFSFNRSTSFTTYDRRPAGLVAVVCMTGAGAGAGAGAGCTIDILDVFRIDDVFDVGKCDCGGIFSM